MRINNYAVLGHFGPGWTILCPNFGKSFFPKTRMPDFGTTNIQIPFCGMSPKHGNALSENTNASKRDIPHPIRAPVAPPENGKSFFPKTRMPQKGTCHCAHWRRLHPLKTAKAFFRKHEPRFL
jgi:hypothetical protein